MKAKSWVLPVIILSQFCCTSLWFASNGVMNDLVASFNLSKYALGYLTSAVQFGFITGTLLFAVFSIADRYSPSKVFFTSAILGSLFNLATVLDGNTLITLTVLRFFTGFFLAGIYPIGMKIAADYHEKGLGKALGYLVGALVVGTALPHLLKGFTIGFPWKSVLIITSGLAIVGGSLTGFLVPDGPFRKVMQRLDFSAITHIFKNGNFRSAAFGYFGHMWELYAFWAFVPIILSSYSQQHPDSSLDISLAAFMIIAVGGLACITGGYISLKMGVKKTARLALLLSGLCCLFSPLAFFIPSIPLFLAFLLFWGMVVIADSPLFSTLVAQNATAESKGTALTIVNCIGFSITIVSIQLLNTLTLYIDSRYLYMLLAIGPIFGLLATSKQGTVVE